MNSQVVQDALKTIKYPGFSRDIVSFGLVRSVDYADGCAKVSLEVTSADPRVPRQLKTDVENTLLALEGISQVDVTVNVNTPKTPPHAPSADGRTVTGPAKQSMKGIKHIIAVASGKGGVGKSTFTVNFASALDRVLADQGKNVRVGIMDCDIYGPSIPLMLGLGGQPEIEDDNLIPMENFGLKVMSMGLLIDEETPVVWRGPMVMKTIQQFAANVAWGELEVLVIDLPPGTGDAHLSLTQTLPLDGAVVITTPQRAAVSVARRGAMMFEKVNVPLLGVVENMSWLEAPSGEKQFLFGHGGGEQAAKDLKTHFLGQIPLDPLLREGSDRGIPIIISHPKSATSERFIQIARDVLQHLES